MDRPNFVMVFPDQWRGDCLSCLGHPAVRTPYLDHIAEGGTLFTAAYSAAPTCIPARACLATGLSPSGCGRLGYRDGVPWIYPRTMMICLREGGYQTMQCGKTHFFPQRAGLGFEQNALYDVQRLHPDFESDYHEWLQSETSGRAVDRAREVEPNSVHVKPWQHEERLHCTNWIMDTAVTMLRRRDPTRPFFLQISLHRPHAPYDPPAAFFDMYRDAVLPDVPMGDWCAGNTAPTRRLDTWRGTIPPDMLDSVRRAYWAHCTHIDDQVGKLYHYLNKAGLLGNTYFLFLSDHGEQLGDHGLFRKATPFEGSARIPLLVRAPSSFGKTPARSVRPTTHADVMPTLLQLAGLLLPDGLQGSSFLPALQGDCSQDPPFVHGEHANAGDGWQYLVSAREKYVWETLSGRELYFDLAADPRELRDLSADPGRAADVARCRDRLTCILSARPQDGLVQNGRLCPGRILPAVR